MAGRKSATIPVIASVVALVAIGLSFIAYTKRIKIEDVKVTKDNNGSSSCIYPSGSAAFAVGILASVLVLIQQILFSVGNGCLCCGRNKLPCNFCGVLSVILFVLSWLSFITLFTGLIATAIINNGSFLRNADYVTTGPGHSKNDCLPGKESLFLGTAIWGIINLVLNLTAYSTFMCAVRRHARHHDRFKPRDNFAAA